MKLNGGEILILSLIFESVRRSFLDLGLPISENLLLALLSRLLGREGFAAAFEELIVLWYGVE